MTALTRGRIVFAAGVAAIVVVAVLDHGFAHFLAVYGRWWLSLGDG